MPDQHVQALARSLAAHLTGDQALVHLSGALPLTVLEPAPRRGSFHPLQSFPTPKPPAHFERITVAVAGSDPELQGQLETIARRLRATPRTVPDEQRTLYHAAAVIAGPGLVALVAAAVEVLGAIGWAAEDALDALLPLVRGTVANVEGDRLPGALIGPVRRGDAATVERQLKALAEAAPVAAAVYRDLGRQAVEVAVRAGLDEADAMRLKRVLAEA